MKFIGLMALGPNWEKSGEDGTQGPIMRQHYDYMRNLYDQGVLVLGGPFKRGPGGLNVLECPDKEQATAALAADPGVQAGLFQFDLKEHLTMFDAAEKFVRPFPGG